MFPSLPRRGCWGQLHGPCLPLPLPVPSHPLGLCGSGQRTQLSPVERSGLVRSGDAVGSQAPVEWSSTSQHGNRHGEQSGSMAQHWQSSFWEFVHHFLHCLGLGDRKSTAGSTCHLVFVLLATQNLVEVVNTFLCVKHLLFLYTLVIDIVAVTVCFFFRWFWFSNLTHIPLQTCSLDTALFLQKSRSGIVGEQWQLSYSVLVHLRWVPQVGTSWTPPVI